MTILKLVAGNCCDTLFTAMAGPSPTAVGSQAGSPVTLWFRLPFQNPDISAWLTPQMVVGAAAQCSGSLSTTQRGWLPLSCSPEVSLGLVGPALTCPPWGSHLVQAQPRVGKS